MAIRYAVASGAWSDTATWDGGTLPGTTDDVYANNKTVTVDQSITVNSLKKIANATPAITANGSFTVSTAAVITLTAGVVATDNAVISHLILINAGAATVEINVPSIVAGAVGAGDTIRIDPTYTGDLTINGNLVGGASVGADGVNCLSNGAQITVNGNVTGGLGGHGFAHFGPNTTLEVNGDVTGGTGSNKLGIMHADAAGSLTVTGDVRGGTNGAGIGAYDGADLTVRGDIYPGGTSTGTPAIDSTSPVRLSGNIYMGGTNGNTAPAGFFPVRGQFCKIAGEGLAIHGFDDSDFPTSNAGDEIELGGGGGGAAPTEGVGWPPRYWA